MQFKVGDVVMLKSGGPTMTVQDIADTGRLYCIWFHGSDMKDGYFEPATLMAPPEPPGIHLG